MVGEIWKVSINAANGRQYNCTADHCLITWFEIPLGVTVGKLAEGCAFQPLNQINLCIVPD